MATGTMILEGEPTWSRKRRIGHYGGALDKKDSPTEGDVPHAHFWYQELQAMGGTAYSRDDTTLVHCERLAVARGEAAQSRATEKLVANSLPVSADEKLAYWVKVLQVVTGPDDTRHDVRLRCAAKYRAAQSNDKLSVEAVIKDLLGDAYVRCWWQHDDPLTTPPTPTYWPGVNPGPAGYDLGGGTWMSVRAHLVIETTRPSGMTLSEYRQLMDVHLFRMLTWLLPSSMTFNWAEDVTTGFSLGVSDLDYVGMNGPF